MLYMIFSIVAYLVLAPLVGGFLAGVDRKITARMQGRVGPPVFQPFYDVLKLIEKEDITVNRVQDFYILCFLVFTAVAGGIFFAGESLLLVIFALTLASVFFIIAAFSSNSPYAQLGAERELLQVMAAEPMELMVAIGFYMVIGTFDVSQIIQVGAMPLPYLIGIFLGLVYILTIKFRKSPFDLSTSHHAHQEMVKGLTTEMSGTTLAIMNIAEYYEMVLLFGIFSLFFINSTWWSWIVAILICGVIFFMETLWDNISARVKWKTLLYSCWVVTLVAGGVNILILMLDK